MARAILARDDSPKLTWRDAIKRVLEEEGGEPLHEEEIAARCIALGMQTVGQTPARTVNRTVRANLDLFEHAGPGLYRIRKAQPLRTAVTPSDEQMMKDVRTRSSQDRGSGQGFQVSPELRQAIELHSMKAATIYYEAQGWTIEDVSRLRSYDLHCTRPGSLDLHVEVKGTMSRGLEILLTANEVRHAQTQYPNVALFVLAEIQLASAPNGSMKPFAGVQRIFDPWIIDQGSLMPVAFTYSLPHPPE